MNVRKYLTKMFEIFTGEVKLESVKDFVFVQLCSSHQTKNWKKDILKFYKKGLPKTDVFFVCALVGHTMNIKTKEELDVYVSALFEFFCARRETDEGYVRSLKILIKISNSSEFESSKAEFSKLDVEDYIPTEETEKGRKKTEREVIYRSSKFYIHFGEMLQKEKEKINENDMINNRFYNPEFIEDFLTKNLSYLPLWSAIFNHSKDSENYKRYNNGSIEGYFSNLKKEAGNDLKLGKIGSIKLGRYVDWINQRVFANLKRIEYKIPDRNLSRSRQKGKPSQRSHSAEVENWRGRGQKSQGIFASTEIIAKAGS